LVRAPGLAVICERGDPVALAIAIVNRSQVIVAINAKPLTYRKIGRQIQMGIDVVRQLAKEIKGGNPLKGLPFLS